MSSFSYLDAFSIPSLIRPCFPYRLRLYGYYSLCLRICCIYFLVNRDTIHTIKHNGVVRSGMLYLSFYNYLSISSAKE